MMGVTARIFYHDLQEYVGNRTSVEVSGHNVGECLDDLKRQFPGVDKLIFDKRGQFLKYVFVFINAESTKKVALAAPVKDGDEIIIAVLLAGG